MHFKKLLLLIVLCKVFAVNAQTWELATKIEFQGSGVIVDNQLARAVDKSGNIYVASNVTSLMSWYRINFGNNNFLNKKSDQDIFIVKYNKNGTFAWARSYGDSSLNSSSRIIAISIDPQGNPVVLGTHTADLVFDNFTAYAYGGSTSAFIAKLNASNGTCNWLSQFSTSSINPGSSVQPSTLDIDNSGNIYVGGGFTGICNFGSSVNPAMLLADAGETDLFVVRLNSIGILQWIEQFKSSGTKVISELKCDDSGNIIIAGVYKGAGPVFGLNAFPASANEEFFILKLSQIKQLEWMKYSTGSSTLKGVSGIDVDDNGNIYALGVFFSDGNIDCESLTLQPFASATTNYDIFLLKFTSTGNLEWLKKGGGNTSEFAFDIDVANNGIFYISTILKSGQFFSPISINSNLGLSILKYGNDGNALSTKSKDAGLPNYGLFEILPTGIGYLAGFFNNSVQFGSSTLTISSGYNPKAIFVAKFVESLIIPSEVGRFFPSKGGENTSVAIYGKNFSNATAVSFNNTISANFRKVNDTLIIAKVPAAATTGKIKVEFTGGTSSSSSDDFIVKTSVSAISNWSLAIQNSSTSVDEYIIESTTDLQNNLIVVGNYENSISFLNTTLTSNGAEDMFIYKMRSDGTLVWAKSFGGGLVDKVQGVCTDNLGNIYITGSFTSQINFGSVQLLNGMEADIFIVKLNSLGNVVWAKRAGGLDGNDTGLDIACDIFGNISITGTIIGTVNFDNITLNLSSLGSLKLFVAKYNNLGNAIWAKEARGGGSVYSNSVAVDFEGNTYIMGNFPGTLSIGGITLNSQPAWWIDNFLAKFDYQGTMLWAKRVSGHPNHDGKIVADADGNVYYAGTEQINNNDEISVAKYNSSGNEQWKLIGQGLSKDYATDIAMGLNGEIAVCGQFNTTIAFSNLSLAGHSLFGDEMFVARIDKNGIPISLHQAVNLSTSSEGVTTVIYNAENEIFVGGRFGGSASFGGTTLVANTGVDLFLAKLTAPSTAVENEELKSLRVYPNPLSTSEILIISDCQKGADISYTVYNNIGSQVQQGKITSSDCSINLSGLATGVYFILTDVGKATFVKNK